MLGSQLDEKAIFNVARTIDSPDARAEYLNQVCGSDDALRERVVALLRAFEKQPKFLESPAPCIAATIDAPPPERVGAQVGPYNLREQIGEGGMGVVYVADQTEPVRRRVALKIIKPGMDSRQVIARFEAERQALALMDHPNIARVLDAGTTETGRLYFVMELVRGVPITEFCDRAKLNTRQRLELFMQVCQAVQHAHQKGIIHRDLKPGNVLVTMHDDKAVPKVIDFGVAKATSQRLTEQTIYTQFSQMVGTPLYMSPEQAQMSGLDVDTRSDVYSLGVLLYEFLTGSTPFDRETLRTAGYDEMRRIIREEEPPRPSAQISTLKAEDLSTVSERRNIDPRKLSHQLRGELDWIVMKALEKDRARRYESASALAADVQRYLNSEAVQACPPSVSYRMRKLAARHRAALITAALVSTALLAGTAVSIWQAVRATHAGTVAKTNAQRADANAQRAEVNLQLALRAVDEMYNEFASDDVMREPMEIVPVTRLAHVPHMTPVQRTVLEKALAFYGEFASANSADPVVRGQTAKAHRRIGDIQRRMGEHEQAAKAYRQAIELGKRLVADFPDEAEYQNDLAESHYKLGLVYGDRARCDQAEMANETAMALREALVRDSPEVPEYRSNLAESLSHVRRMCRFGTPPWYDKALPQKVEQAWQRALTIREELVSDHPETPAYQYSLADSYELMALMYRDIGRHDDAEKVTNKWFRILAKLAEDHPDEPEYQSALAYYYQTAGNFDESVAIIQRLVDTHPEVPAYRLQWAGVHNDIGWSNAKAGRSEAATESYEKAVRIMQELVRDYPRDTLYRTRLNGVLTNQGVHYLRSDRFDEAVAVLKDSIANSKEMLAVAHKEANLDLFLVRDYFNLGQALLRLERPEEADDALTEIIRIEEASSQSHPNNLRAHLTNNIGLFYYKAGSYDQAIEHFSRLVELAPGWGYENRADVLRRIGRYQEAYDDYAKGLANGKDAYSLGGMAWLLAVGPEEMRDVPRAVEYAKEALELAPELQDRFAAVLGMALFQAGQHRRAAELLPRCLQSPSEWQPARFVLAMNHWKLGEHEKAREVYRESVDWLNANFPGDPVGEQFRSRAAELLGIEHTPSNEGRKPQVHADER